MVLDYYKLREHPFGVTPDAGYLFMSATHGEALGSVLYGVEAGCGFVALIAKPGLGKTTLLYHAMDQLREKARTVFLFQTVCSPLDLLRALLIGLGEVEAKGNLVEMQLRLKEILAEQFALGKRVVVVIDEAQNLDDSVLELVRMLSNFETSRDKLIQIVLCGQPQLAEKIASPELVQLRQRISIVAHLKPFSPADTVLYIEHRLRTAGYSFAAPLFSKEALSLIVEYSEGIPRNINNLCFNSLSLGCALRQKTIGADTVREVVTDLDLDRFRKTTALAIRPPERLELVAPAFLAAASASSESSGWLLKLAVAFIVLLAFGGTLFAGYLWTAPKAAVRTKSIEPPVAVTPLPSSTASLAPPEVSGSATVKDDGVVPSSTDADTASSNANQAQELQVTESTIRVTPGKTLLAICVQTFGKCDSGLLQEIHKLNPRLSNIDHIEPGQSIRLPGVPKASAASLSEHFGKTPASERSTQ